MSPDLPRGSPPLSSPVGKESAPCERSQAAIDKKFEARRVNVCHTFLANHSGIGSTNLASVLREGDKVNGRHFQKLLRMEYQHNKRLEKAKRRVEKTDESVKVKNRNSVERNPECEANRVKGKPKVS